jgi:hypothetical protein
MPAGLHAHAHCQTPLPQIAVKLLGFVPMSQPSFG